MRYFFTLLIHCSDRFILVLRFKKLGHLWEIWWAIKEDIWHHSSVFESFKILIRLIISLSLLKFIVTNILIFHSYFANFLEGFSLIIILRDSQAFLYLYSMMTNKPPVCGNILQTSTRLSYSRKEVQIIRLVTNFTPLMTPKLFFLFLC